MVKREKCMDVFVLESKATILLLWQHDNMANPTWRKSSVSRLVWIRKVSSLFDPDGNIGTREMIIIRLASLAHDKSLIIQGLVLSETEGRVEGQNSAYMVEV